MSGDFTEKRSEPRTTLDKYYSVEFSLADMSFTYQFRIWDKSTKGMSIAIKEDSVVLEHLKVGDLLNLKYYTTDPSIPVEYLKTEIMHITKQEQGRFKGHYLVGLSLLK